MLRDDTEDILAGRHLREGERILPAASLWSRTMSSTWAFERLVSDGTG